MPNFDPYVPRIVRELALVEYDLIQDLSSLFEGKKPSDLENNIEMFLKALTEFDISRFGDDIYLHFGWVGETTNDLVKAIDPALLLYPCIALQDLVLLPLTIRLIEKPQDINLHAGDVIFLRNLARNSHLMSRLKHGLVVYVPHSSYFLYLAKKSDETLADYLSSSIIAEAIGASLEIVGEAIGFRDFQKDPFINAVKVSLIYNIKLYSSDKYLSDIISGSADIIDLVKKVAQKRGLDIDLDAAMLRFSKIIEDLKSTQIVRIMRKSLEAYSKSDILPISSIINARSKIDLKDLRNQLSREKRDPEEIIERVKDYLDSQLSEIPKGILEVLGLMGFNATALFFGINPLLALGFGMVALISRSASAMKKIFMGFKSLFKFAHGRRGGDVALDISKVIRIINVERLSKSKIINEFAEVIASLSG